MNQHTPRPTSSKRSPIITPKKPEIPAKAEIPISPPIDAAPSEVTILSEQELEPLIQTYKKQIQDSIPSIPLFEKQIQSEIKEIKQLLNDSPKKHANDYQKEIIDTDELFEAEMKTIKEKIQQRSKATVDFTAKVEILVNNLILKTGDSGKQRAFERAKSETIRALGSLSTDLHMCLFLLNEIIQERLRQQHNRNMQDSVKRSNFNDES